MLDVIRRPAQQSDEAPHLGGSSAPIEIDQLRKTLTAEWPLIALTALIFVVAAVVFLMTAQPLYTASTGIMIDTRKNQLFQNQQVVGDLQIDTSAVESQVEILRSESVLLSAIKDLKLTNDPEFVSPRQSFIGFLIATLTGTGNAPKSENQLTRRAVRNLQSRLTVKRVGATYVLEVGYTSPDPANAARVANGIADAYMVGELEAKYQATRRASKWLQDRIQELRLQAQMSDEEVQSFKSKNALIGTNRGLMTDQQLGDVNAQLITARTSTAEAKARLDRIQEIARAGLPDATVTDALKNDVITRLRAQYLDLAAKRADWLVRYGATHTAVMNLTTQMGGIEKSLRDELRRIAETYKSDYEIARAREESVQKSLADLVGNAETNGQAQVKLRDLESSAQTARNLYDTFLQRSMEATQQQTFPISDARVITAATEPDQRSYPRTALVLAGGGILGLFVGAALAILKGRLDQTFRDPVDFEAASSLSVFGTVPIFDGENASKTILEREGQALASDASPPRLDTYVLGNPFSRAAETLRRVKVEIDSVNLVEPHKVIGVTSSVPKEGKTTIALNLAQLFASSGRRTLLIDCDFRNPSLSKTSGFESGPGLKEVIAGTRSMDDVLWRDTKTPLHVIYNSPSGDAFNSSEIVSGPKMVELLKDLRTRYDYIVLDLPPALPIVDVKAATHLIDGFVFIVEWGKTRRDVITETFNQNIPMYHKIIGVVLNKAPAAVLRRVESYKGQYYRSYYQDLAKRS